MEKRPLLLRPKAGMTHYHVEVLDLGARTYEAYGPFMSQSAAEREAQSRVEELLGPGNIQPKALRTYGGRNAIAVYGSASASVPRRKVVIVAIPGEHYQGCPRHPRPRVHSPRALSRAGRSQRRRKVKSPR